MRRPCRNRAGIAWHWQKQKDFENAGQMQMMDQLVGTADRITDGSNRTTKRK